MTAVADADDLAAPLDALLVDAALGPMRLVLPDLSAAKFAGRLMARPRTTGQRLVSFATELARIGTGASELAPSTKDRRFADAGWVESPVLRRIVQAYIATGRTVEQLIADVDLGWRDDQRVRFLADNVLAALAPSNAPLLNPAAVRAAIETRGLSFVRGGVNLVRDLARPPRIPQMVDGSGFTVGKNLAATPGAVVQRTEMFELIQYAAQTPKVRPVPLVIVAPAINKYYALDLAPERSLVEYLVRAGQQVFVLSWRNPDARHADWGLDTYLRAVLDALDAVEEICGSERTVLAGACSGGILASLVAAHLAGTGKLERLAGLGLWVTVLDHGRAGVPAALTDRYLAAAATAMSRQRGYLDGKALAAVFAFLRPTDLIWHYWVNNYLLGHKPPAFDVLYWNADTTRMSARLHADFVDLALANRLPTAESMTALGTPVDLSTVDVDSYVVAGVADHITPWQSCYRTTALLGGKTRFVLSTSGHIAALVNPPGNGKATYQINPRNPADPQRWLRGATTRRGSWWPDFVTWLSRRCGPKKDAPQKLGGGTLPPLIEAPGTYVFDR